MDKQEDINERLSTLHRQCLSSSPSIPNTTVENSKIWISLYKMISNCYSMYTELDRHSVECRRLGKETVAFREKYQQLSDALDTVDQFLMTAIMMS